jgi:hypothetical protein
VPNTGVLAGPSVVVWDGKIYLSGRKLTSRNYSLQRPNPTFVCVKKSKVTSRMPKVAYIKISDINKLERKRVNGLEIAVI